MAVENPAKLLSHKNFWEDFVCLVMMEAYLTTA
jgi:hypothetical protein